MSRRLVRKSLLGLLVLALIACVASAVRTFGVPGVRAASPPPAVPFSRLTLSQPCAAPTGSLGVSGRGFGANAQVTLSLNTTRVATTTADGFGDFSTTFTIPATLPLGSYTLFVRAAATNQTASRPVVINEWQQSGFDPGHTRYSPCESTLSPTTVSGLQKAWSFNAGTDSFLIAAPAVSNGIVYVGSDTAGSDTISLYAFNSITGAVVWTFSGGYTYTMSPAVAGGLVYLATGGSSGATLYALNAQTGAQAWKANFAADISSPVVANGIVYVGGAELYAFNAQTGSQMWTSSTSQNGFGQPAVGGGLVYAQGSNGEVYAFDAGTGNVLWTQVTDGLIYGGPVYSLGRLYFAVSYPYDVYALDAATGAIIWTTYLGNGTQIPIAIAYSTLYISCDGELFALDTNTGAIRFNIDDSVDDTLGAPVVANGVLYLVESDNYVHAYSALSDAPLWQGVLQGEVYSPGAVVDAGTLYVAGLTTLTVFRLPAASSRPRSHRLFLR